MGCVARYLEANFFVFEPGKGRWASGGSSGHGRAVVLCLTACVLAACEGTTGLTPEDPGPLDAAVVDEASTVVRFEPAVSPMPFGAIPWPDDLYRDEAGSVQVRDLPAHDGARDYVDALAVAASELDGFGLTSPVYFFIEGVVDPGSLPWSPEASLEDTASVFLLDVDTNSADAFRRVPVQVSWQADLGAVVLAPAAGHALFPGRRYAAVLTDRVRDESGAALGASARYATVRDAERGLDDAIDQRLRASHAPVLETLERRGLERTRIAGLAVFTVQTVGTDLADAHEAVLAEGFAPPEVQQVLDGSMLDAALGSPTPGTVGVSSELGAPHDHLGWMIHGALDVPTFVSSNATVHGAFERDEVGALRAKRMGNVPFTLWLPMVSTELSSLPVVVFQHDMLRDRSDALALANQLAERGVAVIAMDAPFHGLRAGNVDTRNRFTNQDQPDGFGDEAGDFLGASDLAGDLPAGHPGYYRDAVRQGAVELVALFERLEKGDWSVMGAADPRLADLGFDPARIGFVGAGTGATMGLMALQQYPGVSAAVLFCAAGRSVENWADSPARQAVLQSLLPRLGRPADPFDLVDDPPALWPELGLFQMLIDRGDALAYAASFQRAAQNLLAVAAVEDEAVHLRHAEELAHQLGLATLGGTPLFVDALGDAGATSGDTVGGNFTVDGTVATRLFLPLSPAGHETYLSASSVLLYEHPLRAPYVQRAEPLSIDNPIAALFGHVGLFFESRWTCATDLLDNSCNAQVVVP